MTRLTCSFCGIQSKDVLTNGQTSIQIAESLRWTVKVFGQVTLLRDPCCVERLN